MAESLTAGLAALEIRVHLTDGTVSRFGINDAGAAGELLATIQPNHIFTRPELIIGGSHSLSLIQVANIESIDFVMAGKLDWPFITRLRDALEITADEFHSVVANSVTHGPRVEKVSVNDEQFDACDELVLSSGRKLYHAVATVEDNLSPVDLGLSLSHMFHRSVFVARRPEGGATIVNPAHVIQATLFPGPSETPPNAWLAQLLISPAEPVRALLATAAQE